MEQNDVCIVIPIYKAKINGFELESLKNTVSKLGSYDIFLCCPNSLNTDTYDLYYNFQIKRFDDSFFVGLNGYNRLCISEDFYKTFQKYKFMLIVQLDVWVFKDDLVQWINKDYDYIGAPWLLSFPSAEYKTNLFQMVGNGGFSLRKIDSIIKSFKDNKELVWKRFNQGVAEDVIFAHLDDLVKPSYIEAAKFSFETNPLVAYKLTGQQKPFGFHKPQAWGWDFFNYLKNINNDTKDYTSNNKNW